MTVLYIVGGGALGSLARFFLSEGIAALFGAQFPWGTLIVNVSGSFVIGCAAGGGSSAGRWIDTAFTRQFVMAGLCGGYTTFSAFSLQTVNLLQAGETGRASLYIAASVALCLLATVAGFASATALTR